MNRYTEEKKDEDVKYKDDIKNNNAINNKVSIHSNKIKTEIDNVEKEITATATTTTTIINEQLNSRLKKSSSSRLFWLILFCLELIISCNFLFYRTIITIDHITNNYFIPLINLQKWDFDKKFNYATYYRRECSVVDQSAFDTIELIVNTTTNDDNNDIKSNSKQIVQNMNRHGVQIFPNILSEQTASELRQFVLEYNKLNENSIGVISNKHRWSFYIQINQHPSIEKALNEMLTNEILVNALQELTGQIDPALTELVVLTSEYGADEQYWHPDVLPIASGAKYSRSFVPFYSMFIPLQNTTNEMGSTSICPGSHFCSHGCRIYCNKTGFQVSGKTNLWQTGYGALINTQTWHKGSAHIDPNGEQRVLLIPSFAARPLSSNKHNNKQLETRIIPHGSVYGSYWTHWGHTISDYRNVTKYMKQPWRTLRSLRIYNPKLYYQSWDFWDQALSRIAVSDVDFTPKTFIECKNYFIPYIPKFLFGNVLPNEEIIDEKLQGIALKIFLLETLLNIKVFITRLYWISFIIYIIFIKFTIHRHKYWNRLFFIVVIKCIILLIYLKIHSKLTNSTWAHNIRTGRLFNIPHQLSQILNLPGTLPLENDILITDHMKSNYLGAYVDVLDSIHPGNREWTQIIIPQYINGYQNLTLLLQLNLINFLINLIEQQGRRILTKTLNGNFGVVTNMNHGKRFIHKELMRHTNHYIKYIILQIDFLYSETQYGYWRDTILHRNIIPKYLLLLQNKILHYNPSTTFEIIKTPNIGSSESLPFQIKGKAALPIFRLPINLYSSSSRLQYRWETETPDEPYDGAWLQEGDMIEAFYKNDRDYWYPGTIGSVNAAHYTYNIVFNDGDTSKNLAPENVRRFYAFSINERIEVDVYQSDEYIPGFIVGIYDDYDVDDDDDDQLYVRIDDSDEDIIKVSRSQLRRETEERREEREASESDESEDEIDDETEQFDDESED